MLNTSKEHCKLYSIWSLIMIRTQLRLVSSRLHKTPLSLSLFLSLSFHRSSERSFDQSNEISHADLSFQLQDPSHFRVSSSSSQLLQIFLPLSELGLLFEIFDLRL
ncbi:hypothetical protein CKAN_00082100 [Cinnamomum micranthum f. kanehirae]|uniref:Uncharacterized protein n=1 Tax=Cinnamomum micranthum f. kanehirae TaxID=337451 RepID=A0A443N230_9MAGN|nr:hypothetical protein CKAN_00082100 [Cinnamomum micranthum f. kanehirae]